MSGQLALAFTLRYQDSGSSAAQRALDGIKKSLDDVNRSGTGATGTAERVSQALRQVESASIGTGRAAATAAQDIARLGDGRAAQGLEQVTRRATAAAAALRTVQGLAGAGGAALQLWGQGAAAVGAARMVLQQPVRETMAYDRRLANLANTAYAEAGVADRQAGMRSLDAAIMAAVRAGGGTREGALDTLDKLVASGVYQPNQAAAALPTLTRFGTAAAAEPGQLADIAIRAQQTFGVRDIQAVLDQAMRAGQLGGFELKDMARWLPQQMAAARQAGLSGESGLRTLLAANQAAVITAGTKDEAGNNLVNLLAKINSQDTANDAKKLGIDLPGSLAAARGKGVNGLDAFVNLVEQLVAKDVKFQSLRRKAAGATGDEQRATYGAMGDILQGSVVGKLVQDRQALMALLAVMNNRGEVNRIRGELGSAAGTGDKAFALIAQTPSFKAEQLAAEKANAMQTALDQVNPLLGTLAERVTELAREHPKLTAAAVAATTALTALAAAAGGVGLVGLLSRFMGNGAVAGTGAAGAAAGMGTAALGVMAAGAAGYGAGTLINDKLVDGTAVGDKLGEFLAEIAAFFGSQEARDALAINRQAEAAAALQQAATALQQRPPIVVQLDGQVVYQSVADIAADVARRR